MEMFKITDKSNRKIRLTKERWKHIVTEHPEISIHFIDIQNTLRFPQAIRISENDEKVRFYYSYHKERIIARYLLVAVKYLNGEGFVITSYFVNKIKGQK